MGTALFASFGYWIGASCLFLAVGYIFNCSLSLFQTLSLTGYGLCGYVIVLMASSLVPQTGWPPSGCIALNVIGKHHLTADSLPLLA